jgi:nitronate monooxygenase
MTGFAGGALASAVTASGGLGLIGAVFSMPELRANLTLAQNNLKAHPQLFTASETLPVGVGLLPFASNPADAAPLIAEFKPAVIWLFAAKELDDFGDIAALVRESSPNTKIWVQVGSVEAAVKVAKVARPDALVLQGGDAGGHGFVRAAGIISLIPEAADALAREGFGDIPLVAAGGIADGRGVAAALALGAQGVVMGTRFLGSKEVTIHPNYQAAVLEASDGGLVTARDGLFDQLKGPNVWPKGYDGRSLAVKSYRDFVEGMPMDEIRRLHAEEVKTESEGYETGLEGRAAIWAGTGVGLVKDVHAAADIIKSVQSEAKEALEQSLDRL